MRMLISDNIHTLVQRPLSGNWINSLTKWASNTKTFRGLLFAFRKCIFFLSNFTLGGLLCLGGSPPINN